MEWISMITGEINFGNLTCEKNKKNFEDNSTAI